MNKVVEHPLFELKKWVWAYFLLLIFEGALRKWVLPGLATPLLLIRDPIGLYILIMVWKEGYLPKSNYMSAMIIIGFFGILTAIFFGHGNLSVALYGARILLIHFPLMFAIGRIFDKEDVLQIGRVLLYISLPMILLIAVQFYSPQAAFVNRGIGGDMAGAGFSGANGYFRPPGTFSFTNGNVYFFSIVAVFVIYFWLNPVINRIVLIMASAAVLASIPLSISRSLFFTILVALFFAVSATIRNGKNASKIIVAGVFIFIGLAVLSQLPFFQTATEAFTSRFTSANDAEGGLEGVIGDRYLGGMISAVMGAGQKPFFGYGIGMGTNVGSTLLSGGKIFLISEEEWGRVIGEMGLLMGLGIIVIRIGLCLRLLMFGYRKMVAGEILPWMMLSFGLLVVPQGQWAQPTNLGFSTLIGGLMFASMKPRKPVMIENNNNVVASRNGLINIK